MSDDGACNDPPAERQKQVQVTATEAVAVASYVGWLLVLLFGSVGIGAAALVARASRAAA